LFPPLYAILDPGLAAGPLWQLAGQLARVGVQLIQIRDKHSSARSLYLEAREILNAVASSDVRVILNDRPDVAAMVGAGGVHVGQRDLAVEAARAIVGRRLWVGVSTHNLPELVDADHTSADYIAVGPVFPTGTKENPDPVVGIDLVRQARQVTRKPLVAIGGITVESAADLFRAGADSVAVIGDLLRAPDLAQRAREYVAVAKAYRG
jgi:thiamine-phosphate pyrophosphorylase